MLFRKKKPSRQQSEEKILEILQRQSDDLMSYKLRWLHIEGGGSALELLVYTDRYATIYKTYYAGERIKDEIRIALNDRALEIFWIAIPASI